MPISKEDAEKLKRDISNGYHDRDDYPPFALASFEDRPRFMEYINRVIDDNPECRSPAPPDRER